MQAAAAQSLGSMRVYSVAEQDHLGAQCLGFVSFLESSGVLPAAMREIVIDRAMAAPGDPVSLDDLKIIVLMVYWSFGHEPDALVLDELCDPTTDASRTLNRSPRLTSERGCRALGIVRWQPAQLNKRSGFASSLASASRVARTVSASSSAGSSKPACR